MFLGEYQHSIDPKGRLIIPAKFRDYLGDQFVLAKGLDGCLFVYPLEGWHELEDKLRSLPLTQKDARAFARIFFSGASEAELDKQGRVLLPPTLRNYAHITKDVMIIGVGNRLEIWDMDQWGKYNTESDKSFEQLAELMGQYGLDI